MELLFQQHLEGGTFLTPAIDGSSSSVIRKNASCTQRRASWSSDVSHLYVGIQVLNYNGMKEAVSFEADFSNETIYLMAAIAMP